MADNSESDIPKFIRRVMPTASEAELLQATETFKRYVAIVIRIHERIECKKRVNDSLDVGF